MKVGPVPTYPNQEGKSKEELESSQGADSSHSSSYRIERDL